MWNLYTSRPRPLMWVWVAMRCFFVVDWTSSILTLSISLSLYLSRYVCVCSVWVLLKQLGSGEQGVWRVCSVRFRSVCMGMANRNRPKWLEINRFRCISVFQREGYWDFQNHTISSKHKQNQHSTPNQDLLLLIQELTNPNSNKD